MSLQCRPIIHFFLLPEYNDNKIRQEPIELSHGQNTMIKTSHSTLPFINKSAWILTHSTIKIWKTYLCPFACLGWCPVLRAMSHALFRSCLSTVETSPVPPSQSLGVLCFPLSPPSRKGATQDPKDKPSFSARLVRLSYHSNPAEKFPTPHKQTVKPQSGSVTLR